MRKFLIPIVAGISVVAIAAPASAQYAPRYDRHNNGYGYRDDRRGGDITARIDRIRGQIRQLEQRRVLSWREGRELESEAADIQRSAWRDSRNGIQPGEGRRLEERLRRLEFRVRREASDRNNRPDYRRY